MDVFKTLILSQPGEVGSNVAITGGSINGTNIGATTPGTGAFTTLSATGITSLGQTVTVSGTTPEVRASASTTTVPFGFTFYNGSDYDASVKHQVNTGTLTIDVGRNSSWGAELDIYVDTVRSARFGKTQTTLDQNVAVSGNLTLATQTPASAGAAGTAGTITWDSSYIYICTATNTWKRVAISTW